MNAVDYPGGPEELERQRAAIKDERLRYLMDASEVIQRHELRPSGYCWCGADVPSLGRRAHLRDELTNAGFLP